MDFFPSLEDAGLVVNIVHSKVTMYMYVDDKFEVCTCDRKILRHLWSGQPDA